jgi:hypothetical protein
VVLQLGGWAWSQQPLTIKKFTNINMSLGLYLDYLDKRPKRRNKYMRLGTWNVRSLYTAGSLVTVSKELSKYRLDLVGVQEVRWEGCGTEEQENTHYSMERGMRIMSWLQLFLCTRASYQQLRGLNLLVIGYHT